MRKIIKCIAALVGVLAVGVVALVLVDSIPMGAAIPPENMKTLQDFETWKSGSITGRGDFTDQSTGISYDVRLAPSGRYLASGPSAYLFDEEGRFVEWTPDMGDVYTTVNSFDLSSGNLKGINNKQNKSEMATPRKPSD